MTTLDDLKRAFYLGELGYTSVTGATKSLQDLETEFFNSGAFAASFGTYPAGFYFYPWSQDSSSSTLLLGANSLKAYPWYVPKTISLTAIGGEVTTVGSAGALVRLGIYRAGSDMRPSSLVVDAGTISGVSATVQEKVITTTLTRGWYYLVCAGQGSPTTQATVRAGGTPIIAPLPMPASPNASLRGYYMNAVTGALPATFTVDGMISSMHRLFIKT